MGLGSTEGLSICLKCLLVNDFGGTKRQLRCVSSSTCHSKGARVYYLHDCPFGIALLLVMAYLPQEALGELQVLQPLFVHSVHFGELGRQNSFLRNENALRKRWWNQGCLVKSC